MTMLRGTRVPPVEQFPDRILGVERRRAESIPDHESRDLKVQAA